MTKTRVAVLFGSRSTEHEISIITAMQVIKHLDREKYEVIPVYITKEGGWLSGNKTLEEIETYRNLNRPRQLAENQFIPPDPNTRGILGNPQKAKGLFKKVNLRQIDVALLCFHGSLGEDGTVQGLLELADIPYTGCGVASTAACMDKLMAKAVLAANGIPTVKDYWFLREEWAEDQKRIIKGIENNLEYPLFVKPVNSGSSIGVTKADGVKELIEAIEVAKFYDRRILVEEGVKDAKEVNISVMGYSKIQTSELEMPVASSDLLSFEDKYQRGGAKSGGMASLKRVIPAPIKESTKKKVEEYARVAFRALDCSGVVRMDFLLSKDEKVLYLNEVNTIPGSLSFYLWEPRGIKFPKLLDKLIEIAFERHADRSKTIRTFPTNVLEGFSGSKGKSQY